ncbi:binder of sperm 5 isoform X2 [Ovis aries]|uniref:binder of sperm 5 isoform X2 n=1 Tax=Ovis aries TaxID=9940 RepID=UPI00295282F9|nr:binder of sperm 5 isoform X2 [Ovis aries]
MAPRLGLFLIWAGVPVFLQLHPVNGAISSAPAFLLDEPLPDVYDLPETPTTTPSYTIAGAQGPPCAFPFTYKRRIYYKCTSVNSEREWCSLDEDYVGRWKICSDGDRPKCHFPFIYRDKRYFRCTTEGSAFGLAWCSLTEYFEREYAWQYCDRY